jgi:hypothetical protein
LKVAIMQPAYLPWLGYFHRISLADLLIVLDNVRIDLNSRTGFAHRNRIRTAAGSCWLTVPLRTKGRHKALRIDTIEVAADQNWSHKHWHSLRHSYGRAAWFDDFAPRLKSFYDSPVARLLDLQLPMLAWHLDALGLSVPWVRASTLPADGAKDELILSLCREVGATTYISGPFGRDYLRREIFDEAGIEIVYHDYAHPAYRQAFPGFQSHLATIDLLMNHGPDSLKLLAAGAEAVLP